jgi:dipeptidyl aminopeptidase/acylaminoacyl peptidase
MSRALWTTTAWTTLMAIALLASSPAEAQSAPTRAITFSDLISMRRVSDPHISPDRLWVAYTVATADLDANRSATNIWIVSASGGDARQLTRSGKDSRPRWSPDGKSLAFLLRVTACRRST